MTDFLFQEKQRFTQWWLWLLLLGTLSLFVFGFFKQIVYGVPFGNKPISDLGLIIALIFMTLLCYFFYSIQLVTRVYNDGIRTRLTPFYSSFKVYKWDEIDKIYIRKYNAFREFGGYGIRFGGGSNGRAFNIAGNVGLQLILKNGDKVLIGTHKGEELKSLLTKIG